MLVDPTPEQVAEMTLLAAEAVRKFGVTPKAALLSHSSFGASDSDSARKMRAALKLIRSRAPDLEIDGEMHADAALSEAIRNRAVPDSRLEGTANLLVMPTLDAANIAFTLLQAAADGLPMGRFCSGCRSRSMCSSRASRRAASSISVPSRCWKRRRWAIGLAIRLKGGVGIAGSTVAGRALTSGVHCRPSAVPC